MIQLRYRFVSKQQYQKMYQFISIRITITFTVCLIQLAVNGSIHGQSHVIHATKIDWKPKIDGKVIEEGWDLIPSLSITQKVPNAGDPPTQKTEIRIVYDNQYLYLSGRMYDESPHLINANSKKRDDFTENTEWCGLLIDSYNDRENVLGFWVTPTGSKLDMAISNDAQGPTAFNISWNTYWDSAVSRDQNGWYAEIRIPFTSLPFEEVDEKVVMGITTWRYLARNDETDIFPPRDLTTGSSFRASLSQRFQFENIKNKRPIHITSYLLGGLSTINLSSDQSEYSERFNNNKHEIGVDAKIGIGSNITLDLTLNTDFAQVEADDQQVNLERTNIFFPEKRLFFQERASLFDFNFGNADKLFHSRRIGIVNSAQTRIYGGVRAIAKSSNWEGGLLNMQTASSGNIRSENFTVFRIRRKILDDYSTIGLIYTSRIDLDNKYNSVYGIDGNFKLFKDNYLITRWAQSFTDDKANRFISFDNSKIYLELSKRSQNGFTYNVSYNRAGKQYNPQMGFEHRFNFEKVTGIFSYNIFPNKASKIVQHGPYLNSDINWANDNGQVLSSNINIGHNILTKSGFTYDINIRRQRERLFDNWNFVKDIIIQKGLYDFLFITANINSSSAKAVSYSAQMSYGTFYNGRKSTVVFSPFINVSQDFSLEGSYEFNNLSFPTDNQNTTVQLSRIKGLYTFNTKFTLSAFLQHNNVTDDIISGLRIRYNPREGNDLYFVYNGALNQSIFERPDRKLMSDSHTIFVKYSHTFHL